MAEKSINEQLKESIAAGNVTIGSKTIVKSIKTSKIEAVVLAKNCPESVKKDIAYYSKIGKIKVVEFEGTGKDLGTFCGKPFSIAAIAIKK